MANPHHLEIIQQGVRAWNKWRQEHPDVEPDLSGLDLPRARLRQINLSAANLTASRFRRSELTDADLHKANLDGANFYRAGLAGVNLEGATLQGGDFTGTGLEGSRQCHADLKEADFTGANLLRTDFTEADLRNAILTRAQLVETIFAKADLYGSRIFGVAVWKVDLTDAAQDNLVITEEGEHTITVDNLQVAQFVHLLLKNAEIRDVIDTIGEKGSVDTCDVRF